MASQIYIDPKTQSQLRKVFSDLNVCIADLQTQINGAGATVGVAGEVIAVGDVVRDNGSGAWIKAQADSLANSLVVGVVQSISGLNVTIAHSDTVVNAGWALTPGARYFLSATTSGEIVAVPDSTATGDVAIVVGFALSSTELFVALSPRIVY